MKKKFGIYVIKFNKKIMLLIGIILLLVLSKNINRSFQVSKILGSNDNIPTIVIDPGHGGIDGGTGDTSGLLEKDINLDVGLKLKKELIVEGFNVIMTREEDKSLEDLSHINESRYKKDLNARKNIVDHNNSNLVVSIHVNSSKSQSARGTKVYFYPGEDEGEKLATSICMMIDKIVYDKYLKDSSLKAEVLSEDYFIIREPECTGVLVETGFISNPEDNKLLRSEGYKEKLALAIKKGILEYLKQ